jgi:hypothetical protein
MHKTFFIIKSISEVKFDTHAAARRAVFMVTCEVITHSLRRAHPPGGPFIINFVISASITRPLARLAWFAQTCFITFPVEIARARLALLYKR